MRCCGGVCLTIGDHPGHHLPPPGLTAEVFDQWITIDDDIETTGEITEEEMTDQLIGQILEAHS